MIRAYHKAQRRASGARSLIPDSAHGTNPASVRHGGLRGGRGSRRSPRGDVDLDDLRDEGLATRRAGLMLTNPTTLGLFEEQILDIARPVPRATAALAVLRRRQPERDRRASRARATWASTSMHFNLHKTFTTPHGGGGPGAGPVAVTEALAPYLPAPVVARHGDGSFVLDHDRPQLDRPHAARSTATSACWCAPTPTSARSGQAGLRDVARERGPERQLHAARGLRDVYDVPFDRTCMHEFVLSARTLQREHGVRDARRRQAPDGLRLSTRRRSTSR